ncbi:MAG: hemolysin XhlA family protein [Planctomycetaceae bacterium]|nr:hemolysin XhlA family protein [Planctomycetaceae bacterium]
MLALALLPLVAYFAFLTWLHHRQTPTLLNGSLDFTLLSWGLFGLITLGPGRLVIPLYLFTAWGNYTWIFWLFFYFVATHFFASRLANRFVVYNCRRELVLPAFFTLAKQIDPKADWSGNVLALHGLGLQWSVLNDRLGNYLLFVPTNPYNRNPHQEKLQEELKNLCRTLETPKQELRWLWKTFTFALFAFIIALLIKGTF